MKKTIITALLYFLSSFCYAAPIKLLSIESRSIPGNKAQILLEFSGEVSEPTGFAMNDPSKMIFDFKGVDNGLSKKDSGQKITLGVMKEYSFVETAERLRMIIDVINIVPYKIDVDRNRLIITLENDVKLSEEIGGDNSETISAIDFRRGEQGEGRVIIEFNSETVPVDFIDDGNGLMELDFRGATISDNLLRRFDVSDFGTNINKITVQKFDEDINIQITAKGDYEKIAYQLGREFIIETRPYDPSINLGTAAQKFKFTGEKISLNFQDVEVRAVIQLIADFTGLNIVASDTVSGSVTLRLEEVPWDQALDFILKSKGLGQRESGNVVLIAPNEEITAREQLELEAQLQAESLAPLRTEFLQVNYASASDLSTILKDESNNLLSARGQISVDERTNILLIKDTAENIINMKALVERLDIPVQQVMIEAQIVSTGNDFSDNFGINFGGGASPQLGKYRVGIAPSYQDARLFADNPANITTDVDTLTNPLFFDFGNTSALGTLGLAISNLPGGTLLDLELQASELEDKSKTIARPRLLTLDQQTATIETGQDIAFTTVSESGADPTTEFKKAVLRLEVTPQITPNDKIAMDLTVNQDAPGGTTSSGESAIDTTSITTSVLVDDGETIVLGGIFTESDNRITNRIPFFSRLPIVGRFFQSSSTELNRSELLIFVTPRIMKNYLDSK